jgi:molecular chaperone DnaK
VTYQLGVDLGTTYSAAAILRDGTARIFELGNRTATIPSVIFLTEDDHTILTGEAATRRAVTEPGRVAREFKRRIGDPTPLLVGGSPYSAEALSAQLLRWIIDKVSQNEGELPERVAVTHPANWGPYKLDLLHQAIRLADLRDVVTLTEPEAAAIHYATLERIDPGMVVAVFDLGGGTFDAAMLRKTDASFDILGEPEGIERLGGIDFDEAVFAFVTQSLGGAYQELSPTDPDAISAVARLRRECVDAKEALSSDTEVTIPVVLPNLQTAVRLTRSEFEQLIRPSLADTIGAMQRAVRSANLQIDDVDLVLLVGGSSRIPLVGQMVGGELGRPVAIDAHPKHSIALGAAIAARPGVANVEEISAAEPPPVAPAPEPVAQAPIVEAPPLAPAPMPPTPAQAAPPPAAAQDQPTITPAAAQDQPTIAPTGAGGAQPPEALTLSGGGDGGGGGDSRRKLMIGVGAVLAIVVIVVAFAALSGGGGDGNDMVTPGDAATGVVETTVAEDASEAPTTVAPTTVAPTTTATPTTTTTTTEAPFVCAGLCAHIDEIIVEGNELVVEWTAFNYVPDTNNHHAHFYYNIYEAEQVGTNNASYGVARGSWVLTQDQPFRTAGTGVSIASAPAGTTQLCVVAADSAHGVVTPDSAKCVDIPAELLN